MATAVMLHGFCGQPSSWDAVVAELDSAWTIVRPSLPGHGPDADPPAFDFDAAVDRLAEEVPEHAVVVGYSLGARLALALALRCPEQVRAALLIGVHPGLEDEMERSARRAWDDEHAELLRAEGLAAFVDRWEAMPLFASQAQLPAEVLAKQRREREAHQPRALAAAMSAMGHGRMPPMWSRLSELGMAVRLLVGSEDAKYLAVAARMLPLLPRGSLRIVEACGHNLALEAPDIVAQELSLLTG